MIKQLLLIGAISIPQSLWAFETTSIQTQYENLILSEKQILGLDEMGNHYILNRSAGKLESSAIPAPDLSERPEDILSDGQISRGTGHIRESWLGGPTSRYDHGVMADSIEASRLYVVGDQKQAVYLDLPSDQVFEDRLVRLADLDRDGMDELIVIRTQLNSGAGIVSYGLNDGELTLEIASETIGLSHRWLNIVGIEDFTGDGQLEIAAVITPHIGGTLTLYQQNGTQLNPVIEQWGFSNHEYGSRELGMSAVLDLNDDGIMDMAVPNENRRDLILLTAKNKDIRILERIKHNSSITSGIYSVDIDNDSDLELVYLLKDGTLQIVDL